MMGHGFHGTLLSQEEFINRIKTDDEFAKTWGDLGYTNDIEKNKSQTMTNNKQSMKLYTEEQVRNLLNEILILSSSVEDAMDSLTPIELLSDDDVYKNYKSKTEIMIGHGFHGTLLSQEEFINRIKTDNEFAKTWGDLGYTNDIEKKNKKQKQ